MKTPLFLLALCVLLGACGGGGSSAPADVTPAPPAPVTDSFTSNVAQIVASASDTSEPLALDASIPTAPETSEPVPVT